MAWLEILPSTLGRLLVRALRLSISLSQNRLNPMAKFLALMRASAQSRNVLQPTQRLAFVSKLATHIAIKIKLALKIVCSKATSSLKREIVSRSLCQVLVICTHLIPRETTFFKPSATLISVRSIFSRSTRNKNPEVGFGVVGTNTHTNSPSSLVINPTTWCSPSRR